MYLTHAHPLATTYLQGLSIWIALNCTWKTLILKVTFCQLFHSKFQSWTILRDKPLTFNTYRKFMENLEVNLFFFYRWGMNSVCIHAWFMCVRVFLWVCICVVECTWTYVRLWRAEMDIRYVLLSFVTVCLKTESLWTWSSSVHLDYLDIKPQGFSCVCLLLGL